MAGGIRDDDVQHLNSVDWAVAPSGSPRHRWCHICQANATVRAPDLCAVHAESALRCAGVLRTRIRGLIDRLHSLDLGDAADDVRAAIEALTALDTIPDLAPDEAADDTPADTPPPAPAERRTMCASCPVTLVTALERRRGTCTACHATRKDRT